jgi:hypothetical protein
MAVPAAPRDATPPTRRDPPGNFFEVATVSADASHANIRTVGALTRPSCALLVSVLQAHLLAGRHDLLVDIGDSAVLDEPALTALTGAHERVAAGGGMLVFEHAPPRLVDAIRDSSRSFRATR